MLNLILLLILVSLLIGLISRMSFLPSSAFCIGWAVGIGAAIFSAAKGELPEIGGFGTQLITDAMVGAMLGGLISATWIHFRKSKHELELTRVNGRMLSRVMMAVFSISLVFALIRWRSFGYSTALSEIRLNYVQSEDIWAIRTANYLSTAISVLTAIYGYKAVSQGENILRASILVWLFQMPLGLITGGRSWLVMPLVFVVFPILFLFSAKKAVSIIRSNLSKTVIISIMFVLAFSYMGYLRLRDNVMGNSITVSESFASVRNYLGIPVSAVGPYSEVAAASGPLYGALSFEFFGRQLSRLGIIDEVDWLYGARDDVARNLDNRLGSTHSSYIPRSVGDFGVFMLPYITAIFIILADWCFVILLHRGLMGYFISLQIWVAAAFAFQEFNPSSGAFWIGIASAYFIAILFTSEGKFVQRYIPGFRPVGRNSKPQRNHRTLEA